MFPASMGALAVCTRALQYDGLNRLHPNRYNCALPPAPHGCAEFSPAFHVCFDQLGFSFCPRPPLYSAEYTIFPSHGAVMSLTLEQQCSAGAQELHFCFSLTRRRISPCFYEQAPIVVAFPSLPSALGHRQLPTFERTLLVRSGWAFNHFLNYQNVRHIP